MLTLQNNDLKKDCVLILLVTLISGIIRIWWGSVQPLIARDSIFYIKSAYMIHEGKFVGFSSPYLYEYILSLGCNYTKESLDKWGIGISMYCGIMLPLIGYYASYMLCFRRIDRALIGFYLALNPSLIHISTQALQDSFFLFIAAIALLFLFKAHKELSFINYLISGFWGMTGCFVRYEGAVAFFCITLYMFLIILLRKKSRKGMIKNYIGLAFGAFLSIVVLSLTHFSVYQNILIYINFIKLGLNA